MSLYTQSSHSRPISATLLLIDFDFYPFICLPRSQAFLHLVSYYVLNLILSYQE
jgi:hypothetical protein